MKLFYRDLCNTADKYILQLDNIRKTKIISSLNPNSGLIRSKLFIIEAIYKELLESKKQLFKASLFRLSYNNLFSVFTDINEVAQKLNQITKKPKHSKLIKNSFFYESFIREVKDNKDYYALAQKAFDEAIKEHQATNFVKRDFIYASIRNRRFEKETEVFLNEDDRTFKNFAMVNTMVEIYQEIGLDSDRNKEFFNENVLPFIEQNKKRQMQKTENTYDLHFLSHASALYYLEHIKNIAQKNEVIEIITGWGAHSEKEKNIQKMKNLTKDFCDNDSEIEILKVHSGSVEIKINNFFLE